MSFPYCGAPNCRQQRYRCGITSAEEKGDDQVHQPSGHTPFCTATGAVGWHCRDLLLADVQPSRIPRPSSPPDSAITGVRSIPGAGLGLCPHWTSWGSCRAGPPGSPALWRRDCALPGLPSAWGGCRSIRNWLRKKNFVSCCSRLLGREWESWLTQMIFPLSFPF